MNADRTIRAERLCARLDGFALFVIGMRVNRIWKAWRDFNRSVGTNGDVGIWHETCVIEPGRYDNVYVNTPPFGLGRVGHLQAASGGLQSASARLRGDPTGSVSGSPRS